MFNFLRNIGTTEVIVIALVILFFFGGKKLSDLAQGIRDSRKEYKKIKSGLDDSKDHAKSPKDAS